MRKLLLVGAVVALSQNAFASDSCKFMLCLGSKNPNGIAECKAVIDKTVKEMKNTKSLSPCIMKDGRDSKEIGSYVTFARARRTALCPAGTIQGRDGVFYHKAVIEKEPNTKEKETNKKSFLDLKIDINDKGVRNVLINNDLFGSDDKYLQRVCIAGQNLFTKENHEWYEDVKVIKSDGASFEFSFFVDGKFYMNHRF